MLIQSPGQPDDGCRRPSRARLRLPAPGVRTPSARSTTISSGRRPPETPSDNRAAPAGRETPSPTDRRVGWPAGLADDRPEASPRRRNRRTRPNSPHRRTKTTVKSRRTARPGPLGASRTSSSRRRPGRRVDERRDQQGRRLAGVVLERSRRPAVEPAAADGSDAAEPKPRLPGRSASAKGRFAATRRQGRPERRRRPSASSRWTPSGHRRPTCLPRSRPRRQPPSSAIATAARSSRQTAVQGTLAADGRRTTARQGRPTQGEEPPGAASSAHGSPTCQQSRIGSVPHAPPATVTGRPPERLHPRRGGPRRRNGAGAEPLAGG